MKSLITSFFTKPISRIVLLHAFCWVIFVTYEISLLLYTTGKLESPFVYVYFYSVNISFFYELSWLLNATFNRPKKDYLRAVLQIIAVILIYLAFKVLGIYLFATRPDAISEQLQDLGKFFATAMYRAGYFLFLAIFYWAAGHIAYFRRQAADAERQELLARAEKADLEARFAVARNAFLQQQINPHLMFNALNFVYSQVLVSSPAAGRCVLLLTDILRFGLEATTGDGKASLDEELEQLNNLIEINRFRFDGSIFINIEIKGDTGQKHIIPLVLLTLSENVFKHGDLTSKEHAAVILLDVRPDGELSFTTRNLIKSKPPYPRKSHKGMENIRIRLENAYPADHFSLISGYSGNYFEVSLKIKLCA